ncbi:hypothetical protein LTR94_029524, partial [Friedmanniomyces endolithicus]
PERRLPAGAVALLQPRPHGRGRVFGLPLRRAHGDAAGRRHADDRPVQDPQPQGPDDDHLGPAAGPAGRTRSGLELEGIL